MKLERVRQSVCNPVAPPAEQPAGNRCSELRGKTDPPQGTSPSRPPQSEPQPFLGDIWDRFKWPLATAASSVAYYSGLLGLYERLKPAAAHPRVIILMYHRVTEDPQTMHRLSVSPRNFRAHMQYLAQPVSTDLPRRGGAIS